jgi:tRNA-dihydrouridine synthase B
MLEIGNIKLGAPVFQAAISGYSDRAMRELARRYGAELTFSGLMLDKSVSHRKMWRRGEFVMNEDEHPIGGQLLGSDPGQMSQAAAILQDKGYDLIDLNFACPAPKVLARGRGGYLLNHPERAIEIFRRVREAIRLPLMLKLRSGYVQEDTEREHFWRICEAAAGEGIDAVIVHGRSVEQRYRGEANWQVVSEVKQRYPEMTVIGSGDLFTGQDVMHRLGSSGLDGVVIARGAIGNPWIFEEVGYLWRGEGQWQEPSLAEQGKVILGHLEKVLELYPARKAIPYFRKFCVRYCRRHPQRKATVIKLMAAKTVEELRSAIGESWAVGIRQ